MASIALPRLSLPTFQAPRLARGRYAGVAAAAVVLVGAIAALAATLGASHPGSGAVRLPLAEALAKAPQGWRQTLSPFHGPAQVTRDVIRLSEHPLAPWAGVSWNRPGAAPPPLAAGAPLPAAPISGFFAPGPAGPLPIIAQDGRTPFQVYRRPFTPNGRPRVALVIGGLGLDSHRTQQAIETLPAEITLSFTPYAEGLQGWIDMARAHGHEVLIEAPMEPIDYPDNDPGPYTLMAKAQSPETVKSLEWILSRATGYFGVTNYLGSRFLTSDGAYQTFSAAIRGRGLAFFDDGAAARRTGGGLLRGSAERVIDDQLNPAAIDQQLVALEAGALQRGQAIGAGFAYPVTLEKVAQWAQGATQRGFQLTPASAFAHQ